MSNPFDEDNGEILEGFLCPICREDLRSIEFLTDHVENFHAEEQDALKSIFKDIFSKAKRKIKSNFDDSIDLARSLDRDVRINSSNTTTRGNVFNYMVQNVGAERSHFSYFTSVRNPRLERYASETNKLIIRLHKLLKDMPAEPVARKQHEQNIVPWLDGSSVKLCPNCAKSFHIARRQHHCRLCGSIMCNDCSKFLPLDDALELASLTLSRTDPIPKSKDERLNSIRTCDHCLWLLETRKEMHDSRTCRPPTSVIYDEIQQLKKNILPDIDMYLKIINSLYSGDSIFTLADASALRGKIGQVAEIVDLKSKKILMLPCQEGTREEAMKKSIRLSCVQFIKERMLSIPPLPGEVEIKKIQDKKRMETEQRIETERRLALEAYEKYGLAEGSDGAGSAESYASGSALRTLDNWSAYQISTSGVASNDPLVEQINIIKGYIKQARTAMRFDEVATLELNLRELQKEFYMQHQKGSNNTTTIPATTTLPQNKD
ncbi:rabenosyn-5 [Eupeodes corollae]|uniref:rabenosyn-5 n=1 Tax=Eupeodes corollae TaxID=290404 RepID=UPI002490FDC7|nr:rabenosyn-5 [Eupeodes corollae]